MLITFLAGDSGLFIPKSRRSEWIKRNIEYGRCECASERSKVGIMDARSVEMAAMHLCRSAPAEPTSFAPEAAVAPAYFGINANTRTTWVTRATGSLLSILIKLRRRLRRRPRTSEHQVSNSKKFVWVAATPRERGTFSPGDPYFGIKHRSPFLFVAGLSLGTSLLGGKTYR